LEEARWGFEWESMTEKCIEALVLAQREAEFLRAPQVGTEHVLIGLLSSTNLGAELLAESNVDANVVRATMEKFRTRESSMNVRRFSWRVRKAVELAFEEARGKGEPFINTDYLYVGLFSQEDCTAFLILQDLRCPMEACVARLRGRAQAPSEGPPMSADEILGQLRVAEDAPHEEQVPQTPPLALDHFLSVLDELSRALQTAQRTVEAVLSSEASEPVPSLVISMPVVDDGWPVVDEEVYQIGGLVRQILSGAVLRRAERIVFEPSPAALRVEYHTVSGGCDAVEVPAILANVVPFKVMRMASLNPMEKGREMEGRLIFHHGGRSHRMRVRSEPILKGFRVEVLLV